MKKIAALIALAIAACGIAIAFPQTAIAQSLVVGFPESTSVTLVFEGTPNSPFNANIWTLSAANKLANPCGLVIVSTLENPKQFVTVGSQTFKHLNLPVQTLPVCSGGVLSEPRTANFKTPDGKTVLVNQSGTVEIRYLLRRKRGGTFNACGLKTSVIKLYDLVGADSIQVDFQGEIQSVGDLEQVAQVPLCRKVGSNFVRYVKQ